MDIKSLDDFYRPLWDLVKNEDILKASGYIEDPVVMNVDVMPIIKESSGIILLLTGCFAPVHDGHIEALDLAKKFLEEKSSSKVVLGLLGLCHDKYVKEKVDGFSLEDRLLLIKEKIGDNSWIQPYFWEALQTAPVNFTTVINSLKKRLSKDYKIVFVYGSDNYNFRLAFLNGDLNICVVRYAVEKFPRYLVDQIQTNTVYINSSTKKDMSSSLIRKTK